MDGGQTLETFIRKPEPLTLKTYPLTVTLNLTLCSQIGRRVASLAQACCRCTRSRHGILRTCDRHLRASNGGRGPLRVWHDACICARADWRYTGSAEWLVRTARVPPQPDRPRQTGACAHAWVDLASRNALVPVASPPLEAAPIAAVPCTLYPHVDRRLQGDRACGAWLRESGSSGACMD